MQWDYIKHKHPSYALGMSLILGCNIPFWTSFYLREKDGQIIFINKDDFKNFDDLTKEDKLIYEYERQGPAPRSGLAPPVLIFQTSPSCNIFIKISKF